MELSINKLPITTQLTKLDKFLYPPNFKIPVVYPASIIFFGGGKCSYIRAHRVQILKQSISKEINSAEHNI